MYIQYTFNKRKMNRRNPLIAALFSVILTFGISLSVTHVHIDDFHDIHTMHQVSGDEYMCLLCASVVKFSPTVQLDIIDYTIPRNSHIDHPFEFVNKPIHYYTSGRAPPSTIFA